MSALGFEVAGSRIHTWGNVCKKAGLVCQLLRTKDTGRPDVEALRRQKQTDL